MKNKHSLFLMFSLMFVSLFVSSAFAANARQTSSKDIKKIVSAFNRNQVLSFDLKYGLDSIDQGTDPTCPPVPGTRPGSNCMQTVCTKLGTLGCDSQSELAEVAKICSTQFDGSCISDACTKRGSSLNCDDMREIQEIGLICSGQYGSACMNEVCKRMGSSLECDDIRELSEVGIACSRVNYAAIECLKFTCSRMWSTDCDDIDELSRVLNSCKGN